MKKNGEITMKNYISCLFFTIFLSFNTSLLSNASDIKDEEDETKNVPRSRMRTIPSLPNYLSSEQKQIFWRLGCSFCPYKEIFIMEIRKILRKLSILDFRDSVLLKKDSPDKFIVRGI